jgi:hypothetical protein
MCYSATADPLGPMKHHKNRTLRIQLANLETSLEFVFTVLSLLAVGFMNISSMASPDHGKTSSAGSLVISGLIQYVLETACDFVHAHTKAEPTLNEQGRSIGLPADQRFSLCVF